MSEETTIDIDGRHAGPSETPQVPPLPDEPDRVELGDLQDPAAQRSETQRALTRGGLIGAISAGTVSLGAHYFYGMDAGGQPVPPAADAPAAESQAFEALVLAEAPFATAVSEDMSFGAAFAAARAEVGPGGFFSWHGQLYNTYYESEWNALSAEQRLQYLASLDAADPVPAVAEDPPVLVAEQPAAQDAAAGVHPAGADTPQSADGSSAESPEVIPQDHSGDGIPDAYLLNADEDPFAEAVLVDEDQNDIPEAVLLDTDGDNFLDAVLLDSDQDGNPDEMNALDEPFQVQIPAAGGASPTTDADDEGMALGEDQPDMDDDADMSDWG